MRDPKIESQIQTFLKPRPRLANKKDFGRIFVLAGSRGFTGAAILTSFAALRTGAGLVTLGCPDKVYPILARRHPEVMVRPFPSTPDGTLSDKGLPEILRFLKNQDVLAIGPGLGRHPATTRLVQRLAFRSLVQLVMDADGINAFQGEPHLFKKCEMPPVLTPHPGEFVRIFGGKKPESDSERKKRSLEIAKKFKVILVLKGYRTVIAAPYGRSVVNPTGNPGMATGGTGDVLTGIIAALIGQGIYPFDAARFGVYAHGLAGDLAARKVGEVSLVAGDLLDFLPQAIQSVLKSSPSAGVAQG